MNPVAQNYTALSVLCTSWSACKTVTAVDAHPPATLCGFCHVVAAAHAVQVLNSQSALHCHAWLCPAAAFCHTGMSVHLPVYVTSSFVLPASKHSTLCPQVHHWATPADRDGCFHIHARHDDTSISIAASPPQTRNSTDPPPAVLQLQPQTHALSCQIPSASVPQAQHHPDQELCTSQQQQRLSDACVPSPPGNPSNACQGGWGSTPGTGSQAAYNDRLVIRQPVACSLLFWNPLLRS